MPGEEKLQGIMSSVENLARSVGVNLEIARSDPVTMVQILRAGNPAIVQSLLPGEEKMKGVMCGIDAVGYQARDR